MISSLIEFLYMAFWEPFPWALIGEALLEPIYLFFNGLGL